MRVCLAMLEVGLHRVWPVHLQHLWRISNSTDCCPLSLPQVLVAAGVRPVDPNDLSESDLDEGFDSSERNM